MKKIVLLISILTTFGMSDTIVGGEINIGGYSHTPTGTISFEGNDIDVVDTLKWENKADVFASFYFEHPIPLLPNIKVAYSALSHEGAGGVDKNFEFAGKNFRSGFTVNTGIDVKMLDATLYYELLDNWVSIDVGLTAKFMDGSAYINSKKTIVSKAIEESTTFKGVLPLVYSKFRFDIPTTDIALQIEGNYVAYQENLLYDIEVGIRYTVLLGMGAEVGFKQIKLKIEDLEGFNMDNDFSGFYGKLVWDF